MQGKNLMDRKMIILRGLPGAGKSTYCQTRWPQLTPAYLAPNGWPTISVSADHYFMTMSGEYRYDPAGIGPAHAQALCNLIDCIKNNVSTIVVDNTHAMNWEWKVAARLAEVTGYTIEIVDLFDSGKTDEELAARNTHGVPVEAIKNMRAKWQIGPPV